MTSRDFPCICTDPNRGHQVCPVHGQAFAFPAQGDPERSLVLNGGEKATGPGALPGFSVRLTCDGCGAEYKPGGFHFLDCTRFLSILDSAMPPMPALPHLEVRESQEGADIAPGFMLTDILSDLLTAHPRGEYQEEDGPVLWWRLPIEEAPYVGAPTDAAWAEHELEGYYTHWSRIPIPSAGV